MTMDDFILAYYQEIRDGDIIVGKWIRLLYEMIMEGLENELFYFDKKKANKAIKFIEKFCRHNKGKLAPGRFILSLWEKAAISLIFGIVDERGKRQFKEVALFVGRKCGKTLLAAAIIAYVAYVDGEFGSEIYCVAPKLDQSDLVFSAFEFTKDKNPELAKRIRKRKSDYIIDATNTTIKKIAFNEKKSDGYNPMLTVGDEMSSWPAARGLKQYEVMVSGTGAREEPITLSVSSGGYVSDGPYDELFKRGTRVLLGESSEKHLLPIFYMIDDVEKWDDINELHKSLPGIGTSIRVQTILEQIDIARESLSKKAEFLTKFCNIKQNSTQAWLPARLVESAYGDHLDLNDFRENYCVGGIDLSQTRDLTAASVIIEKDGQLKVFAHFWLPAERIEEATQRDGLPYELYIQRGLLSVSGENYVDYHDCYNWFRRLVEEFHIYPLMTGYDRWSADYLIQDLKGSGFHVDDVHFGENLYGVLMEMQGLLEDGVIDIGDNDLLKAHLLNCAIKMSTERGRGRLVKLTPNAHIDGVAAMVCGFTVRQKWYGEIGERLKNEE